MAAKLSKCRLDRFCDQWCENSHISFCSNVIVWKTVDHFRWEVCSIVSLICVPKSRSPASFFLASVIMSLYCTSIYARKAQNSSTLDQMWLKVFTTVLVTSGEECFLWLRQRSVWRQKCVAVWVSPTVRIIKDMGDSIPTGYSAQPPLDMPVVTKASNLQHDSNTGWILGCFRCETHIKGLKSQDPVVHQANRKLDFR